MNEVMAMLQGLMDKAWPLAVTHVQTKAFALMIAYALAAVLIPIIPALIARLAYADYKQGDPNAVPVLVLMSLCAVVTFVGFGTGALCQLPDVLQPEGATIRLILGR